MGALGIPQTPRRSFLIAHSFTSSYAPEGYSGNLKFDPSVHSDGYFDMDRFSPRFLCRPTTLYIIARAVERQSAIYTENSGFASPTLGQHISTLRGYRILFSIRNPYINRFTNHFSIHS